MEGLKRLLGLVKTPSQLVDRMLFEFRVMDGEETTEKPRKVWSSAAISLVDFETIFSDARLLDWRRRVFPHPLTPSTPKPLFKRNAMS